MVLLHPISDFIDWDCAVSDLSPTYWYEGLCPQTGELLRLPRTRLVEKIAYSLMQYLATDDRYSREGKMYGVLLVERSSGEQGILKAFSGLLNASSVVEGWVPPIPGREQVALDEARTLTELEAIKQELITLKQLPQRQQYETLSREFELRLQALSLRHKNCKQQRQEKRQICCETLTGEALKVALEQLDEESRQDGIERRILKRQRDEALQPLKQLIAAADGRMCELKQQRKQLSRQLQAQMHAAYTMMNFLGNSRSLQQLMPGGLPTGTGDCCAPKLLHYAATQNLKPLAMAEFWWGSSCANGDKIQGEFYGACADRCQPLMGFLLSGLSQNYIVSQSTTRQEINLTSCTIFHHGEADPPTPHSQAEPGNYIVSQPPAGQEINLTSCTIFNHGEADPPTPHSQAEPGNENLEALPLVPPTPRSQAEPGNENLEAEPLVAGRFKQTNQPQFQSVLTDFSYQPVSQSPTRQEINFHSYSKSRLKPTNDTKFQSGLTELSYQPGNKFPGGTGGTGGTEQMLPILYEDEWLIVINKPPGLLSVPGRYFENQDSVLSRLRNLLPDGNSLTAVHRLDRETSGILLLARDLQTYRQLSQQFQQRQVSKVYEAVLSGIVTADRGAIALPLWGNPENRPYQQVDWQYGKPSVTRFQVMAREGNCTRVEFMPLTGRTHQLRVHAADARGLGMPILGDRLYGCRAVANRLHLHARELCFQHPQSGKMVQLQDFAPF
ncbi:RluA family pseudouridine synthase [Microseira wollei]|uniref:RNA pseudouridylate synthase n=1 Tax=Microseira wollei NIES-4236 TaxID=2530354 RepID=A0AAV3XAV2_9CYAN|nr:RluA family pseudouridine synthase [Microseira wollei]GET38533.1 pseudouridine synthase [Microseira wollei NIES-4236]